LYVCVWERKKFSIVIMWLQIIHLWVFVAKIEGGFFIIEQFRKKGCNKLELLVVERKGEL